MNPPKRELDRVRRHTSAEINRAIDQKLSASVRHFADAPSEEISERLRELEREWDVERVLETNAASLALAGIGLSATVSRKWLVMPGIVLGFLLLHAVQGWCPPLPLLRRAGIRTRGEIDRERFALKYLRGDFDVIRDKESSKLSRMTAALAQ